MAVKIRLARGGSKKRPFYRIVAADERAPRDGNFIEKLGTYNPLLAKDNSERIVMNVDRIKYWLGTGAQPTDRVARFLWAAGLLTKKPAFLDYNRPKKAVLEAQKKAEEEAKAAAEAAAQAKADAEAAAAAEAAAPAEEAAADANGETAA